MMKARKQMVGLDMTRMGKRSRKFCGLVREGVFMRVGAVGDAGLCGASFGDVIRCVCGVCVCDFTRGSYVFPKKKKRKLINVSSQRCEHTLILF